ncbi:MAG: hypothetical protein HC897_09675 [Thermoanaerobaculia bacterium]|nr:hypothetical protein [Thermoanaerobaculia bacterium]
MVSLSAPMGAYLYVANVGNGAKTQVFGRDALVAQATLPRHKRRWWSRPLAARSRHSDLEAELRELLERSCGFQQG